jgi:hypothetical protein
LALRPSEFVDLLARVLGRTRKEILNSLIDFAHSHYLRDKARLRSNLIVQTLPADIVKQFRKALNSQPERDGLNSIDVVLFGAAHAGALLQHYVRLSDSLGTGVATSEFSGQGSLWNKHPEIQAPIEGMAEAFCLVRAALHEEGAFFPRIESIKHALKLRSDPNLKAFREQLASFQQGLMRGDGSDLFRLVKEVHRSAKALKRTTIVQRRLNWLTYASLPASVIETLYQGLPVASVSLSIFSIVATKYADRVNNRHRWVLFGR